MATGPPPFKLRSTPDRLNGLDKPTVWGEFTPLAVKTGSFNLGQGFPDWPCPQFCKDAVYKAVEGNCNQYTRSEGHALLVKVLSEVFSPLFDLGRPLDPLTEIAVTVGATEGLYATWQGLLDKGDEVIVLEPAFDVYWPQVQMAGGSCKFVPLRPSEDDGRWYLDIAEFEAAFTERTKAVLLNTPHNPTGKVFSREELQAMAEVVQRHPNVVVVTDEVYERIVFDGHKHERMATIPGMWERTLTISSAGKTFSTTGWKIGWCIGPKELVKQVITVNQQIQFSIATPLQEAVATSLREAEKPYQGFPSYYAYLSKIYSDKRDRLMAALKAAGMTPIVPEGGIFVMADTADVAFDQKYMEESTPAMPQMTRDWAFCRWLTLEKGVTAIPPSSFYTPETRHLCANLARFAFCKEDATLEGAAKCLEQLGRPQKSPA